MSWYLADLVMRADIDDDPRSVVHVNSILVDAPDAATAYDKAQRNGRADENAYANRTGKTVRWRFVGLAELIEIYEPLEDGAEIVFTERIGLDELSTRRLVKARERLSVFRPRVPGIKPDYAAGDIVRELDDALPPRIDSIHHVELPIPRDGEPAARHFYVELLGMSWIEKPARPSSHRELWLQAGDRRVRLAVATGDAKSAATSTCVTFAVTKFDAFRERLERAGVAIIEREGIENRRCIEVHDPFGNRVELVARDS